MHDLKQFAGKTVSGVRYEKIGNVSVSVEIVFSDGSTLSAENGNNGIVILEGTLNNEVLIEKII